jgi:hypothetical protein
MPETVEISVMHRIRNTPMRDVVRGRLTGRLDVRARVGAALPKEAAELVVRVVRRTRLRAMEKIDVADELVAHFADGLERGASVAELIRDFGDERNAARLIARAKRRGRPGIVRVVDALGWLLAACAGFYVLLTVWFYIGSPSPTTNYIAVVNRESMVTPASEQAWPDYFAARSEIGELFTVPDADGDYHSILDQSPRDKAWPQLVQWLGRHQASIERVRQAAKKPALGFRFGPGGSEEAVSLLPGHGPPLHIRGDEPFRSQFLYATLGNTLASLNWILIRDADVAVEQRDPARYVADIRAIVGMLGQFRRLGVIDFAQWAELHYWRWAVATLRHVDPSIFSDEQLTEIVHLAGPPQVAADLLDMRNERLDFYDTVQRMYSDDARGDGRLTLAGIEFLYHGGVGSIILESYPWIGSYVAWPSALLRGGSRRKVVGEYDRLMNLAEANFRLPRRLADWSAFDALPKVDKKASPIRSDELLVAASVPADLPRVHDFIERALGERDGAELGIALEIFHRRHKAYPGALSSLVPDIVPALPVDRITGEPLHYRIVDGKPLIYSVGSDRRDDGGKPPIDAKGRKFPDDAAEWRSRPGEIWCSGDWVLYPFAQADRY